MNACMCTDNYACVCLLCPRVANQVPRHLAMSNPMVVPGGMEYQTDLYRSIQNFNDGMGIILWSHQSPRLRLARLAKRDSTSPWWKASTECRRHLWLPGGHHGDPNFSTCGLQTICHLSIRSGSSSVDVDPFVTQQWEWISRMRCHRMFGSFMQSSANIPDNQQKDASSDKNCGSLSKCRVYSSALWWIFLPEFFHQHPTFSRGVWQQSMHHKAKLLNPKQYTKRDACLFDASLSISQAEPAAIYNLGSLPTRAQETSDPNRHGLDLLISWSQKFWRDLDWGQHLQGGDGMPWSHRLACGSSCVRLLGC